MNNALIHVQPFQGYENRIVIVFYSCSTPSELLDIDTLLF
jgi:hypothetical protein